VHCSSAFSRRGAAFGGDDYLVLLKNVGSEGIRNLVI